MIENKPIYCKDTCCKATNKWEYFFQILILDFSPYHIYITHLFSIFYCRFLRISKYKNRLIKIRKLLFRCSELVVVIKKYFWLNKIESVENLIPYTKRTYNKMLLQILSIYNAIYMFIAQIYFDSLLSYVNELELE